MDTTLESILELRNKHHLYHDFILYLQNTWCLENLLFYQDVQDFCQLHTKKSMIKKYHIMMKTYIKVNSIQEINIPCDMRESLLDIKDEDIHSTMFDEIAESILELIRVNSYLPWSYQYFDQPNYQQSRRNTLTPSLSVPEHRWQHLFTGSRPSFTSLRDVEIPSSQKKMVGLFQRKRQAIMIRVKKTFILENNNSFSWLAKK